MANKENELWIKFLEDYRLKHALEVGEMQQELKSFSVDKFEIIPYYEGLRVFMNYRNRKFAIYEKPKNAKSKIKIGARSLTFNMKYEVEDLLNELFSGFDFYEDGKEQRDGMIKVLSDFVFYVKQQVKDKETDIVIYARQ
ncbi:hypothetical protein [Bacillus thuringiensis]|uniref:hypothetical protein n=1 Tax=Bacillus thuringiensis TaxID=1428 RepID=UPI0021D67FF7|nr:hypothetical protein [Bacillus thuringiensis]MCU7667329.1 hypothetical protein [Bacillus thuringiensis]